MSEKGIRLSMLPTGGLAEDLGATVRLGVRISRHVDWLRRDGLARLVEEDNLDPRERIRTAVAAWRWRHQHPHPPGMARVALVVGVQRSGTNMILRGIERNPAVEVHNENDRRVFDRFRLRGSEALLRTTMCSRQDLVLLKPLCDSQRTTRLLDLLDRAGHQARAVWVYRGVDGRARSAVAKFGDVNRRVLIDIARGTAVGRWQAEGLSEASLELIASIGPERLDPESAAALFWLVRNRLYLEQGLVERVDVHLVSYERVIADPEPELGVLAAFLGLEDSPSLWAHVDRRASWAPALDLNPRVRSACRELEETLDIAADMSHHRVVERTRA